MGHWRKLLPRNTFGCSQQSVHAKLSDFSARLPEALSGGHLLGAAVYLRLRDHACAGSQHLPIPRLSSIFHQSYPAAVRLQLAGKWNSHFVFPIISCWGFDPFLDCRTVTCCKVVIRWNHEHRSADNASMFAATKVLVSIISMRSWNKKSKLSCQRQKMVAGSRNRGTMPVCCPFENV